MIILVLQKMDEEMPDFQPIQYEYLDHTADVQLHSWGNTMMESIEQLVNSFYGYHTSDITTVERQYSMDIQASGHDEESMIYNLLQECLYLIETEPYFIGRICKIQKYSSETNDISIRCWGESFDKKKHPSGTCIKAITYSGMQIHKNIDGKCHIYLIVDI
uniref:Archease domain-containing protein n=1 Tax=Panagrolaimus sp. JU765 TaxID=591449 RepID=A0AC34RB53_9BILA